MRAWWVGLWVVAVLGCADERPLIADAGEVLTMRPDAVPETCRDDTDPKTVDFYGEVCHSEPFPANTECHSDFTGWCIDDVCRPMCHKACPRCPGGVVSLSPAGACYCQPRS